MTKHVATGILKHIGVNAEQDFHTLTSGQVDSLIAFADIEKYRKPANANGSRGRYFYQFLQRKARSKGISSLP